MKKRIFAILSVMLILSLLLSGCGDDKPSENAGVLNTDQEETVIEYVELTLPASLYEGIDMTDFDWDAYVIENNFVSASTADDGSVVIVMEKARYDELVAEATATLEALFAGFINSEDTPYIKEITHNSDFSVVNIKVIRSEYEQAFDFAVFSIGLNVTAQQMFLDVDCYVEINVIDVDTGEIINTTVYPEE